VRRSVLLAAAIALTAAPTLLLATPAPALAAGVSNPTVEGPITGGVRDYPWNSSVFPLAGDGFDYEEAEYFYGGTATDLTDSSTSEFKSRMVVRRPKDAADFNGIVLFDWMNVTNQQGFEFNWWPTAHEYLMQEGYMHVAVSAQRAGVTYVQTWDPTRYATLSHPGDDWAKDIFSQAMQSLREPGSNGAPVVDPTGGLDVKYVVAGGVSQSAGQLTAFINQGYNRGVVDAYNIERNTADTFEDFSVLIFELNEENALSGPQEADQDNYVVWEEAGASHETNWWWDYRQAHVARDQAGTSAGPDPVNAGCQGVNEARVDQSVRAMLHHTQAYLEDGTAPPSAPRVERVGDTEEIVRDDDGNALGGLRHSFIEVPIGSHTGEGCVFWGNSTYWTDARVGEQYPTRAEYVAAVTKWSDYEVAQGWLLAQDRDANVAAADALTGPWPGEGSGAPDPGDSGSDSSGGADAADDATTVQGKSLANTGGGFAVFAMLALGAGRALRRR
jgi:hypothetical protein